MIFSTALRYALCSIYSCLGKITDAIYAESKLIEWLKRILKAYASHDEPGTHEEIINSDPKQEDGGGCFSTIHSREAVRV
jgi:hypothetical protein